MKKIMRAIIVISAASILCVSCMSYSALFQIIPQPAAEEIPLGAKKILIHSSESTTANFNKCYKALLSQDYRIENDNKEMGYISASKSDIGDTFVRLNITCSDTLISVTSEWKAGSTSAMTAQAMTGMVVAFDWEKAQWNKRADKSSVAFANAVSFCKQISSNLNYFPSSKPVSNSPASADRFRDPVYF
jgi:hypothetical protein